MCHGFFTLGSGGGFLSGGWVWFMGVLYFLLLVTGLLVVSFIFFLIMSVLFSDPSSLHSFPLFLSWLMILFLIFAVFSGFECSGFYLCRWGGGSTSWILSLSLNIMKLPFFLDKEMFKETSHICLRQVHTFPRVFECSSSRVSGSDRSPVRNFGHSKFVWGIYWAFSREILI